MKKCRSISLLLLFCLLFIGKASAEMSGKEDYVSNCAGCHGTDGKGGGSELRTLRGYISVDLTHLGRDNGGQFPRQKVYDTIDGRKRFAAHFRGDMPRWGFVYQAKKNLNPQDEDKLMRRISALADYIESIQEK